MSGSLIKAGDARLTTRGMYRLDLRDIARQAEGMLAAARFEAERVLSDARAQARREAEALGRDAAERGYQEGLTRGREEGRAQALEEARRKFKTDQAALGQGLSNLLSDFARRREEFLVAARRDAVVLAVAIASRIVERLSEIESHPGETATAACAEALDLIASASEVRIRTHPDDLRALDHLCNEVRQAAGGGGSVRFVEDEGVGRGGIVLESAEAEVDATVAARVQRVADQILSDWRERAARLGIGP